MHISATRHHLTGTLEPPEPPYAPPFHPQTGYLTFTETTLFFRALSAHSRLHRDVKSTADVAVHLSLLREGLPAPQPRSGAISARPRMSLAARIGVPELTVCMRKRMLMLVNMSDSNGMSILLRM